MKIWLHLFSFIIIETISRAAGSKSMCVISDTGQLCMQTTRMPVVPCCICVLFDSSWKTCSLFKCLFSLLSFKLSAARVPRRNIHRRLSSSPTTFLMNPRRTYVLSSWILVVNHQSHRQCLVVFEISDIFSFLILISGLVGCKPLRIVWMLNR